MNSDITLRIQKAIEIKKSLIGLGINEEICIELKRFYAILNDWVRSGTFASGKIKLEEICKKLIYQLDNSKNTVVKLVHCN